MQPTSSHPRAVSTAAALALLLWLAAPAVSAPHLTARRQTQPAADVLTPGSTVKREIWGGRPDSFGVALAAGEYAQVFFLWGGTDLDATVFRPDGSRYSAYPLQVNAPGPASASVIADAAGEYRFEVHLRQELKLDCEYAVRLGAVRQPTRADQSRVLAERALAEGTRLRISAAGAPSGETPEAKLQAAIQHWRDAEDPDGEAAALQALADVYLNTRGDFAEAAKTYAAARAVRQKLGEAAGEGHVLLALGEAYQNFSSPYEALQYYDQASALFRGAGDRVGESMALYDRAFALALSGKARDAVDSYEAAKGIQSAGGPRPLKARTLTALGAAYDIIGDHDRALDSYNEARQIALELGDRITAARLDNNIGVLHDNWNEWDEAKEKYEAAREAYSSLLEGGLASCAPDAPEMTRRVCMSAAAALENLGELSNSLGEPEAALSTFEQSLAIRDKLKRPKWQGSVRARMCYSNLLLGRPREALTLCKGDGAVKGALSFQEPGAAGKPSIDPPGLALTYMLTGMAYDALGEREQALDYFGRAVGSVGEIADKREHAIILDKAGAALALWGDTRGAFEKLDKALSLWREIKDRDGEALTLYNLARAELGRGNLVEAHARVSAALDIVESLRVKVTAQRLRASYFGQRNDYYELAVDLKMQLAGRGGLGVAAPAELVASALQTSERARARVLLDILTQARLEPGDGSNSAVYELVVRRNGLQQKLDHEATGQTALLVRKAAAESKRRSATGKEASAFDREVADLGNELAAVEKRLSELASEYDDVDAQVRARSPRYAGLTGPQPLSVAEIQNQLLDDQTILLEYSLGERRSYLWVVARSGVKWFGLPGREEIEEGARRVRDILRDEQKRPGELEQPYQTRLAGLEVRFREEAGRLSGMLLGPAAAELGRERLLIVAGGELQQVPFAALPAPEAAAAGGRPRMLKASSLTAANEAPPLAEEHEIVSLPSASTLAALRAAALKRPRPPKAVAVLADPVFDKDDPRLKEALGTQSNRAAPAGPAPPEAGRGVGTEKLSRLMASRREAEAIKGAAPAGSAMEALDFAANRATATDAALGQYRIVHFATHAFFDDEHPELSSVVLSLFDDHGRPREDGFLRLRDVYNLDLPVDMVVLSACQTGLGKQVRGEGLIGLTRGFMYAGAARVVASLWKVDDDATAALMEIFYLNMLRDGLPPPAALRQAQMSVRRRKRWSAPYYWAGFVLQGEWKSGAGT